VIVRRVEFFGGPFDGAFGETADEELYVQAGGAIHLYVLAELLDATTSTYAMRHAQILPIGPERL